MTEPTQGGGAPAKGSFDHALRVVLPKIVRGLLPKQEQQERFMRAAWMAVQQIPELTACSPGSFITSVAQCALLELELGGALGQAYVLPYNKKAQLIVGYKGLVFLGRRAGILDWQGRAVRQHDDFDYWYGAHPNLIHKPFKGSESKRGDLIAAYSVAWLHKDMEPSFRVLYDEDVERRREVSQSKASKYSPWVLWPEEMWQKSAMKAHANQLSMDERLSAALELEDRAAVGEARYHPLLDQELPDVPRDEDTPAPTSAREDLKAKLKQRPALPEGQGPAQPIEIRTGEPAAKPDPEWEAEQARQRQMDAEQKGGA